MRDTTTYDIARIPRTDKYIVCYKRSWLSSWKHYIHKGKAREFNSYAEALAFVRTKNKGYLQLRLVK